MKKRYLILSLVFTIFLCNNSNSATFSSFSSGPWNAPATWSITGVDANGVPDFDDDVIINNAHKVTLTGATNDCKSLIINTGGVLDGNTKSFRIKGNFTVNGSVKGTITVYFQANSLFSSASVYTNPGNWNVQNTTQLTIALGTVITKNNYITLTTSAKVFNNGSITLNSGSVELGGVSTNWHNLPNSKLRVGQNIAGVGNFNATYNNNTVEFFGSGCNQIKGTTYYNLSLYAANAVRKATSHIVVLNDLELTAGPINNFDLNNFNLTVGGNWLNLANKDVLNQGLITFNGSGNQLITRGATEKFTNMLVSGTGTVTLGKSITVAQDLTISANANLSASSSNYTVNLQGNFINDGTLIPTAGNINFNGSTPQSISGSSTNTFYNLTLNNPTGLTVNRTSRVSNALTVTNGNFNSNGNLTLVSDVSNTARIAPVGAGGSFSGNMIIQQYISGRKKGWHDLSSPVQSTTIFDWDDEMYMSGIGPDDGIPGPGGVDGTASGFVSVKTYKEPQTTYAAVSGKTTPLISGKGYRVWLAENQANWVAKTIDTRGIPTFGDKTIALSFTDDAGGYGGLRDGLNLIGNPYASAVNYSACVKTNLVSGFLVMDNSGNFVDLGDDGVIPPHQGIWVQASSPGAFITFNENAKSTSNSTLFHRVAPNYAIKLVFSSPQLSFYHENTIKFNPDATVGVEKGLDMVYLESLNLDAPAMYMPIGQKGGLITNYVSDKEDELTIPLALFTPSAGVYYIEPSIANRSDYNKIWLENIKTGKKFDLLNNNAVIEGIEGETNRDYVLRLSKNDGEQTISQSAFENDLVVFNVENTLILKANASNHLIKTLSIYDLSGKLVLDYSDVSVVVGSTMEFNISELPKGLYIVNAIDSNNHLITKKIVK